ncbi:MAG: hypothetical protein O3A47_07780 [Chloroflexi bacterium]|nr:hypothetical protein [Chloroflexota bacterium]
MGGSAQRNRLIEHLAGFVVENAKELPDEGTKTVRLEAGDRLSEVLPAGTWLELYKHDPAKLKLAARQLNYLRVCFGWGTFGATEILTGDELAEFRKLIKKVSRQLGVARQMGIQETVLVLVEIGFSAADPRAIESTVRSLVREEYDNIDHIYLVGYPAVRRLGGIAGPPQPESASP